MALDPIINYTKLFQDIELATAIGQLKSTDASQLQQYLQQENNKVFQDVMKQKDNTFDKVYGDLGQAMKSQQSMMAFDQRNKELADIQRYMYDSQKGSADAVVNDKNIATRKNEMNEWSVQNKNDTLFVFSMLFIMLSVLVLLTVLWKMHIINSSLWVGIGLPFILIFTFTVVNRSQYTDVLRNKRYWNKQDFSGKYGKIPIPSCTGISDAISSAESRIENAGQSIRGGFSSFLQDASDELKGAANYVSSEAHAASNAASNAVSNSSN
jgi:hypothetical protein